MDPNVIAGGISYTKNIWRKFDIGISGNYWDKAYVLNFSLLYNQMLNNKLYVDFGIQRFADYYSRALLSNVDLRLAFSSTGFSFIGFKLVLISIFSFSSELFEFGWNSGLYQWESRL